MDYFTNFLWKRFVTYKLLMFLFVGFIPTLTEAHWKDTYHDSYGYDHNHYSNELWRAGTVVAGTMFKSETTPLKSDDPGSGNGNLIHVMEVDAHGGIVWENVYDFGENQRCFDVCVISEDEVAITGTADGHLFVATIQAGGNVLNTSYYDVGNNRGSVGLSILYSEHEESLFVGGYGSTDAFNNNLTTSIGVLLSLDIGLNLNWGRELLDAGGSNVAMVSDLTELPGHGVYVTGLLGSPSITTSTWVLSALYDYQGSVVWNKSFKSSGSGINTGANAVYDEQADELFVLFNYDPLHSFAIKRIVGASSVTPTVVYASTNLLLNGLDGGNYAGFDIEIDPNDDQLLVAGMTYYQRASGIGVPKANSPTFLAKVSRSNAAVLWLRFLDADNIDFRTHDDDIFQAFYTTHPFISHPDLLTVVDENQYQIIGYESSLTDQSYGVTLINTHPNGEVDSYETCQQMTGNDPVSLSLLYSAFESINLSPDIIFEQIEKEEIPHSPESRCASDCNLTINHIQVEYVGCYTYNFNPDFSVTTNGTVLWYQWNWGDGTISYSSGPENHSFSPLFCSYDVCVTVVFESTVGDTCTDTYCQTIPMVTEISCGPCGGVVPGGLKNQSIKDASDLTWNIYPNPATDVVTVQFDKEVADGMLTLYNATGQKVKEVTISGTAYMKFDVSDLPGGVYTLQSNTGSEVRSEKLFLK